MSTLPNSGRTIRVGIYNSVAAADKAIGRLLGAGYHQDQITVICSDEAIERHFREFEHQDPAGTYTPAAAVAGGVLGAVLGGLAVVAGTVATGGVGLLATGGLAAWAGGVVGGLVGAMMTRGVERELADFYDQAVVQGKVLVAAELTANHPGPPLTISEEIFRDTGAETVALEKEPDLNPAARRS